MNFLKNWRPVAILLAALAAIGAAPPSERATVIRGARLFDGTGAPATVQDVVIQSDRIVAIGRNVPAPRGSRIVYARGLTLLPGLHDLHTHLRSPGVGGPDDLGKAYAGNLINGVTTVNDFSMSGEMLEPVRRMTGAGAITAPRLNLAIRFGVPGGHGTERGWGSFFTLNASTAREAHAQMAKALAYRPDLIKIFADGWRYENTPDLNSMNKETLGAIVADAHAAGVPVFTHTVTLKGAKMAAAAGVDALAHGIGDALVDAELIALMKKSGTFYVPTLVAYEPQQDRTFLAAEWKRFLPLERRREMTRMTAPLKPIPAFESRRWRIMQDNVRLLKAAGIRIGVGTDGGIGGIYHGSATLREIQWLAKLGLSPAEALAAATSGSADILDRAGNGRIVAGGRADLLLTGGRPDERIADLYDIRRLWVAGRELPLKRLHLLARRDAPSPLALHRLSGPIDTGAGGSDRSDLGTLIEDGSEPGGDYSKILFTRSGARLHLVAHLGDAKEPFAQLVIPLTKGAVELTDARGFTGVALVARGEGQYALGFDSYAIHESNWFKAPFEAGKERREVQIPFTAFASRDKSQPLDLARLRALIIRIHGKPDSKAFLEVENIRFYK
ncbi:MAG TPA: amidohydrolase family protein [Sphingomicrobium sp.]|nr:amidohydrolase family protein [Sphingomicrobium sp.]